MAFLHGCAEGREKPSGSTDWISRRVNAAILRFAQNQKENPVGTEAAKPPEYSPRLHPATERLPSQGPIPPIRGKCPEGTKGVGMLSAKLTERLLQICNCLMPPAAPSFLSQEKRWGRKECVGTRLVLPASEFRQISMFQASFHSVVTSRASWYAPPDTVGIRFVTSYRRISDINRRCRLDLLVCTFLRRSFIGLYAPKAPLVKGSWPKGPEG